MSLFKISSLLILTLNSAMPLNFNHIYQSNNDVVIGDNGDHVNLRQYNEDVSSVQGEEDEITYTIDTTNVDYDLRYIYGGKDNYLNFNIWDLVPTTSDSKDTSFKFLCMKPVGNNLYLYLFHTETGNRVILNCDVSLSTSTTSSDSISDFSGASGLYKENFVTKKARYINSYGYKQRFIKFCIDDLIKSEENRVFINSLTINYNNVNYSYDVNDECLFNTKENEDFMYEYFKDNYVRVTEGEVSLLLINKQTQSLSSNSPYWQFYEDFYYFFNTSMNMEEIIDVQYDYELLSYDVEFQDTGKNGSGQQSQHYSLYNCYGGLYKDEDSSKNFNRKIYSFFNDDFSQYYPNNKIDNSVHKITISRPPFLWFTNSVVKEFNNILDCRNYESISDENLKNFAKSVNESRKAKGKNTLDHAFLVHHDVRENYSSSWQGGGFLGFGAEFHVKAHCHEVKETLITWLKFRNNGINFEFNVLDFPKDTESVFVEIVPLPTLGDQIVEQFTDFWSFLTNSLGSIGSNFIPIVATIGGIILLVILWPLIKALIKLISFPFAKLGDRLSSKKRDKNKEENIENKGDK